MLELYSATWCSPCTSLKQLLKDNSIEVKIIDIDQEPEASRLKGIRGIPTLINPETGQRLVGSVTLTQVKTLMH